MRKEGICRSNIQRTRWISSFWVIWLSALFLCDIAHGQGVLGVDPTGRSSDAPAQLLKEQPKTAPPLQAIPPAAPTRPKKKTNQLPLPQVFVKQIKLVDNEAFSEQELLSQITLNYINQNLTADDLEAIRTELTRFYVSQGYINSGVIIPPQHVTNDGIVTFRVIEGKLTDIRIEKKKGEKRWFRPSYIKRRIARDPDSPLNLDTLRDNLRLLQQDEQIQHIQAQLLPGARRGEGILSVQLEEKRPYELELGFDNYQSPTVGAERGFFTLSHQNVLGFGDRFSFTYGLSDGVDPRIDISYSGIPLPFHDTTVTVEYRKNDFNVVEEPFDPLDVESQSDIYSITLRHPVWRTISRDPDTEFATQEVAVSLMGEHLRNKTFLLGERFSFSRGAQDGKSIVSALRFSLDWLRRTRSQIFAARSRFSFGLDVLGATNNRSGVADGQFFVWLGQFQWARRLRLLEIQTIFRLDVQLTDDPLLSLEQIAVGGRYSVRGYRENQLVRDNGLIASLEARLPVIPSFLLHKQPWAESLEIAPFVDYGRAWNTRTPTPHPQDLVSIGIGLRWSASSAFSLREIPIGWRPQFELYWGHPLKNVRTSGGNIQDDGIHLQLLVSIF